MKLNVNAHVKIKLTKSGADILNNYYKKWNEELKKFNGDPHFCGYKEGDHMHDHLWQIFQIFGEFFILGNEAPFMEILIDE